MSLLPHPAGFLPKKSDADLAARKAGKDRHGYTLAERVEAQKKQLALLKPVLQPKVFAKLEAWCQKQNREAPPEEGWPKGLHRCPMGHELFAWLIAHGELLSEMDDAD